MPHLSDEQLAALATEGEDALGAEAVSHLSACGSCRTEADAYLEVAGAVRAPLTLTPPPAAVWDRISAELFDAAPPAVVVPLRGGGRGRWTRRIAFAAAASFAFGAASMAVVERVLDRQPAAEVIESIALDPLPGWSANGAATLKTVDEQRVLVVDLAEDVTDGYREVWLIDRNVERLVSLGTMSGARTEFAIPDGLDLTDYVVVDVSREDFDGNPSHSGDSIVRGVLS